MIIACAGRRIDAPEAQVARFPLIFASRVRDRLSQLFQELQPTDLVASGACGADLIAHEVAEEQGIHRHMLLPFAIDRFRQSSVIDRPGDWGPLYDRLTQHIQQHGDLIIVPNGADEQAAYLQANHAILRHAQLLATAQQTSVLAVLIWDGQSRGPDDITAAFGDLVRAQGIPVHQISTL